MNERGEACISEFLFALITGRVVRVEGGDVHQIHRNRTLQTHPRRQSCPRKSKLSHFLLYHSITTPLSQLGGVVVGKVKGGGWKSVFSFFHPSSHSCKNPRMPEQQPRYHLQAVIKVLSSRVHGLAQVIFCMLGKLTIVETKGETWRGVGGEGPLSYRFYYQLTLCPPAWAVEPFCEIRGLPRLPYEVRFGKERKKASDGTLLFSLACIL